MHRYSVRGAAVLLVVGLVVGGTAGVGWAKGKTKPTIKSSLSSSSITLGNTTVDTVVLTGTAAKGSPTGSVTFSLCGPTSVATPCTSGNAGSAVVGLTTESMHRSTASVTINPTSTGWFCLLDQYGGDGHYKAVSDNDTATECVDVTSGGGGGQTYTPKIASSVNPSTISSSGSSVDTVTMTGNATAGSPTGSISFFLCGPTSVATPCTSPSVEATVGLTSESGNRSTANVTLQANGSTGWFCFLDEYSGDSNYKPVSDNDTATECVDITSGGGGQTYTPTITSSVNPSTISSSGSSVDTVTMTGNATAGSPTGSISFFLCGPTSVATPCTSPSVEATVGLTSESGNRSTANVTMEPNGSTGWFCFLDQYSGDSNYKPVSDNDTSTECVDVTNSGATAQSVAAATLRPGPHSAARQQAPAPVLRSGSARGGPAVVLS